MTPEETALLTEELELAISVEDIADVLPLTQGEGSIYRKDETGAVSHEKVSNGSEMARVNFRMSLPKLQSPDFKTFMNAAKHITEGITEAPQATGKTYSNDDIESVKTGGIIGDIANQIVKKKHGQA